MAVTDFLFQGKTPPTQSSSSSSTSTLPAWYQTYLKGLIDRSNSIAGTPYTPYTGPRVAPFNPTQQKSFDMTNNAVGAYKPYMDEASSYMTKAGAGFNGADAKQWESPYLTNVTDAIARLGTRNLTENILPGIDSTFTGSNGWGGSRHAEFTQNAIRNANESILNQQAETLQQGEQASMNNYLTSLGLTSTTGGQLGALGQAAQTGALTDAAAVGAVGQQQQNQTQQSYDTAYNDFLNQLNYPYQQAAFMQGIMQGFPVPQSTYTTNSAPGSNFAPSPLASLVGGLGIGQSLFGKAKGGRVRKYAEGGGVYGPRGGMPAPPLSQPQWGNDRVYGPRNSLPPAPVAPQPGGEVEGSYGPRIPIPNPAPAGGNGMPTNWGPLAAQWQGFGGRMPWRQGYGDGGMMRGQMGALLANRFATGGAVDPYDTPRMHTAIYGRRSVVPSVPRRGALSSLEARPRIKPPFQGFKPMAASGPGPRRAFA